MILAGRGLILSHGKASNMVIANKNLLREVSRLAIRDELLAMRIRGRLVTMPVVMQPAKQPDKTGETPRRPIR